MSECNPESEITFHLYISGYGNNSHGCTCCMCGSLLTAIEFDGLSLKHPGIGQVELHFRRECFESGYRDITSWLWGGYVCSEGCGILVREWLLTAPHREICPEQHDAKGLAGAGPPARVLSSL
ncbi:hypothetical protein LCGC14_1292770 [marine sediment metagenome]|uniref:Uncharacterized protein n=1 Tax=marine sediment metagenome TaxID=412755 RepID=A0A0F9KS46_9ZZZZ